jgi:hypothetical protein
MKTEKSKLAPAVFGIAIATLLGMASAHANLITYSLDTGNSGISGYTGPYGSVDVDLTSSTTATITFTGNTVGGYQYAFGGQGVAGVNVNASSWSFGSFSGVPFNSDSATVNDLSNGGSANEDGFGKFNQTFDNFDGFAHSWHSVSFVLTDMSGTWADAANVLGPNAGAIPSQRTFLWWRRTAATRPRDTRSAAPPPMSRTAAAH